MQRRAEQPFSTVRLMAEVSPMGYARLVQTLRRCLVRLDGRAAARKLTVRFETPPGHQAQADWAHAGGVPDAAGRDRPAYAFTVVLSCSRTLFARFCRSMAVADPSAATARRLRTSTAGPATPCTTT